MECKLRGVAVYKTLLSFGLPFFAFIVNAIAAEKILLGPHIGDATIVSVRGVNSDKAVVSPLNAAL